MTYKEGVKEFEEQNKDMYIERVDYWIAQLAWTTYTDMLASEGAITERQYNNWATPFPYGKPLKPKRKQLEGYISERM